MESSSDFFEVFGCNSYSSRYRKSRRIASPCKSPCAARHLFAFINKHVEEFVSSTKRFHSMQSCIVMAVEPTRKSALIQGGMRKEGTHQLCQRTCALLGDLL
jgi:hypothetical protein